MNEFSRILKALLYGYNVRIRTTSLLSEKLSQLKRVSTIQTRPVSYNIAVGVNPPEGVLVDLSTSAIFA